MAVRIVHCIIHTLLSPSFVSTFTAWRSSKHACWSNSYLSVSFFSFSRHVLLNSSRSIITWSAHDGMDRWFVTQSPQINLLQSTHFFLTPPFEQISQPTADVKQWRHLYVSDVISDVTITLIGADACTWRNGSNSAFVNVNQTRHVEVLSHVLYLTRDAALRTRDFIVFALHLLQKHYSATCDIISILVEYMFYLYTWRTQSVQTLQHLRFRVDFQTHRTRHKIFYGFHFILKFFSLFN